MYRICVLRRCLRHVICFMTAATVFGRGGISMGILSREDLYRLGISIALAIRSLDLSAQSILFGHLILP